jgi:hypothetical protein
MLTDLLPSPSPSPQYRSSRSSLAFIIIVTSHNTHSHADLSPVVQSLPSISGHPASHRTDHLVDISTSRTFASSRSQLTLGVPLEPLLSRHIALP